MQPQQQEWALSEPEDGAPLLFANPSPGRKLQGPAGLSGREGGPCFLFFVYLLLRVYEKIWNLVPSFPLTQKFLRSLQTQLRLHHLLFLDVFRFPGSGIAASLCS